MWTFEQRSGRLLHDGALVGKGYAGAGQGKNNPELQDMHNIGPIPQGLWEIVGPPRDTASHGPFILGLAPDENTNTFARSGFLIHGDSASHPGSASEGCIIMARDVRERVWNSGDRQLKVVSGDEPKNYPDSFPGINPELTV